MLPNGKVLTWSASQPWIEGDTGTAPSRTLTSLYDPWTGDITPLMETSMMADMLCSGISILGDGRIMMNGGSSSGHTALYDPLGNRWDSGPMMNIARGYNSTVTLSTGEVLTLGGSWSGSPSAKDGEIWSAAGGWRTTGITADAIMAADPLDDAQGYISHGDNHPWLFAASDGRAFHAGPSKQMNWIDTTGNGTIAPAGTRGDDDYSMNGMAAMYAPGQILKVGGAPSYTNADATASAYAIDITTDPVGVRRLSPMAQPRAYANAVVLPGGSVLIIGGQSRAVEFTDDNSVLTPELWSPLTEQFTALASLQTPRNYHSVALLMPDARVFSGGGGLCGYECAANHQDAAIFSPPYLFLADGVTPATRPTVTVISDNVVSPGATLTVTTSDLIASFELIRMSATTHVVNTDQRRVPVSGVMAETTNTYTLSLPADPGVMVPGYWMLFALDRYNTPSVAAIIGVTVPIATAPANVPTSSVTTPMSMQMH